MIQAATVSSWGESSRRRPSVSATLARVASGEMRQKPAEIGTTMSPAGSSPSS